ncbi:DUF6436 domain-containing protein [Idiomarina sp. HP20-50]|uniref:DUF6436 domain-containing protein n=1 Tax=Idiomarina sp. HP20-50 TaxID=3070813 RepID=UPI00294AD79F|nr:DUF6436 domain-containing protein [Idiomarina sp. HP20-50]MDV6314855.1 DUF6436 domain-containing protein [Idiomarina sp. HP20-50]
MTKTLSKSRNRWLIVAVIVWFGLVLFGISYLLEQRLVWFDEQELLLELSNNESLERELVAELKHLGYEVPGRVFHITSQDCSCNWRSSGHIASVKRQVTESDGQNLIIDIDQVSSLKDFVPATPAIIMFNKSSKLIYIGPYADGAFCTTENSFVEELIPSVSVSSRAPKWVNTVAKGCYCKV